SSSASSSSSVSSSTLVSPAAFSRSALRLARARSRMRLPRLAMIVLRLLRIGCHRLVGRLVRHLVLAPIVGDGGGWRGGGGHRYGRRRLLFLVATARLVGLLAGRDLELLVVEALLRLHHDLLLQALLHLVDVLLLDGDQQVGDLGVATDD